MLIEIIMVVLGGGGITIIMALFVSGAEDGAVDAAIAQETALEQEQVPVGV